MAINATATQFVKFSATSPDGATTFSLQVAAWLEHRLIRIHEYGHFDRNADDSPVMHGPVTNQKYLMSGRCWLMAEEAQTIDLINQVSSAHIREKTGNHGITIDYTYKQIQEFGARTRALADTTVETPIGTAATQYYPKFLMQPRVFELSDDIRNPRYTHQLNIELEELTRIAP